MINEIAVLRQNAAEAEGAWIHSTEAWWQYRQENGENETERAMFERCSILARKHTDAIVNLRMAEAAQD